MKKFIIKTLGCKVNQYESEAIAQYLKESGLMESNPDPAINGEDTKLYIINTCTVTQKASMQSRQAVRQAIRSNPNARIIVTGCYAQTEPDEIKKIKGVHYIIGHSDKHKIPEMIISEKEKGYHENWFGLGSIRNYNFITFAIVNCHGYCFYSFSIRPLVKREV